MAELYNYCLYSEGKYQSSLWDVSCPDYREELIFDGNWVCTNPTEEEDWDCGSEEAQSWEPIIKKTQEFE